MEQQKARRMVEAISRRAFLRSSAVWAAAGLVVACGAPVGRPEMITVAEGNRPIEQPVLPSPAPVEQDVDPAALAQFLTLSAVLTGFDNLNPELGRVYLSSLQQSGQFATTVAELYQAAGLDGETPPATVAELEAAGFFEHPATQELADKILEMWYTGIYDSAEGEQEVATYVDALVWQAITFTKPLTICGMPGFWAQPPQQALA